MLNKLFGTKSVEQPPVFAVGTGRCGTHLLESLMKAVKGVDSNHIQDLLGDSFYRYAAWNEIPVDMEGFFAPRAQWIAEASKKGKMYFESNPYLSFHMAELAERFDAKFIFIYRNAEAVVKSHVVKGWYGDELAYGNGDKVPGFQYHMQPNHFFGRMVPRGKEAYDSWAKLTRVGKISWMYRTVNERVHQQMQTMPERVFPLKVEDLTYAKYQELVKFLGMSKVPSEKEYKEIFEARPGKSKKSTEQTWNDQEWAEFREQVAPANQLLGYD
ncbi:MAG TPA: hypothetical protein DCE41_13450 [Cytophagales bacterium]|nr:hypothetical protein [Cytophagales bacterium]HAA19586.1 hypothetical protein [Cytophagales bacterium]HAP58760.1 hypothetical protein [Cytophagales bacterium]